MLIVVCERGGDNIQELMRCCCGYPPHSLFLLKIQMKEKELIIKIYNPFITREEIARLFSLLINSTCNPERKRDLILEVENVLI